jgi:hypothetical protein
VQSPGDYTLTLTDAGYVDPDDDPSPISLTATVTGTGTATPSSGNPLVMGLAGAINAKFRSNSNTLTGQSFSNLHIDAAILSLKHSFIVDHYNCAARWAT